MIEKQEKIVISFKTTLDALAMEEACIKYNIKGRLIPLPKSIDASCGMAFCANPTVETAVLQVLKDENLCFQGIYYEWI